jgi:hypothetical protein
MCFSPTASFGAGILLTGIGVASMTKVRTRNRLLFAAIPFLFGVQQFTEGFVWLGLEDESLRYVVGTATTVFLFFAQVLWPTWVPLAVMHMEPQPGKRRRLLIPLVAGILDSSYYLYSMLTTVSTATIDGAHIRYAGAYPEVPVVILTLLYSTSTVAPFFMSSLRRTWLFGTVAALSYGFTYVMYAQYVVSVWCFFAAILSMIVYLILYPPPVPLTHRPPVAAHGR